MWGAILKFFLPVVIDLAIKWGIPAAAEWLMKKVPFVSKELIDQLMSIVKRAIEELSGYHPTSPEGVALRRMAKQEAKQCIGAMCMATTKSI